jgi:hypothetical protein
VTFCMAINNKYSQQLCMNHFCTIATECTTNARGSDIVAGKYNIITIYVRGNYVQKCINKTSESKGKVVLVLNELSTTPWRRMGEWMYRSTFC